MGGQCVATFPGGGRRAGKGRWCACRYGDGKELPTMPQVAELTKPVPILFPCVHWPSVHHDL